MPRTAMGDEDWAWRASKAWLGTSNDGVSGAYIKALADHFRSHSPEAELRAEIERLRLSCSGPEAMRAEILGKMSDQIRLLREAATNVKEALYRLITDEDIHHQRIPEYSETVLPKAHDRLLQALAATEPSDG